MNIQVDPDEFNKDPADLGFLQRVLRCLMAILSAPQGCEEEGEGGARGL